MKKSIFSQILIPIVSLILLCTITVSVGIYSFAENLLYKDITNRSGALLEQIDGNFTNLMQQLNTVLNVSDASLYFRTLLTDPVENQLDLFQKQMELHRFLYNYYPIFTQFKACATVLGKNGVSYTTYNGDKMLVTPQSILNESWAQPLTDFEQYEKTVYTFSHDGITTATKGRKVLLFARTLVDGYTMEQCGIIFLEIDPSGFSQLYAKSHGDGEFIFITDSTGSVISSNLNSIVGQQISNIEEIPFYKHGENTPLHISTEINNKEFLAVRVALSSIDGYLVKYIDTYIVAQQLGRVLLWIVIIGVFFCTAACVFSFFLFRRLTHPLSQLSQKMTSTRFGHVDDIEKNVYEDEIETLERTFANLLLVIDTYTKNIEQESTARREAELSALRMQIRPHFLYNTLTSIRYLNESSCDRQRISEALNSFISLLRGTISNKKEFINLSDEIANLQDYVLLMNLRYENRIHFQVFSTDDNLLSKPVPKLILQPIIENAVFHGFPKDGSIMEITLYLSAVEGVMRLEITDNGCGIEPEILQQLQGGIFYGKQNMTGVGLNNIEQRLKLTYGAQFGLEVCSTVGMGTIITVRIPFDGPDG